MPQRSVKLKVKRWLLLRALAALAGVCCASAAAQSSHLARPVPSARAVLEQCVQQADGKLRGLDDLIDACPGIEAAIGDTVSDAELPAHWQEHVSARALSDWGALAARYQGTGSVVRIPEPARLLEIAHELPPPAIPPPTLWQQVRAWVRAWLGQHRDIFAGLRALLSSAGGKVVLRGFLVVALLSVVGAAAWIVYREVRALGLLGPGPGQPRRLDGGTPRVSQEEPGNWDLAAAPPHLRPVLLLRRLVKVLNQARRLEQERILTCRELVTSVRLDTDAQRERFAALTVLAERALYGSPNQEPAPQQEAVLAAAQSLEAQLIAPAQGASS